MSRNVIKLDLDDLKRVKLPQGLSEGKRTQLQKGDVLISITADIGIVSFVNESVPLPAYINQHIALVRFDQSKIDGKYASYYLAAENSQKWFRGLTDTGAKAGMSLPTIRKIRFACPPPSEQRAIADALSDADALISELDQLIAKKRDLKQAAMQQLLTGQRRLPGFIEIWEKRPLGDVVKIQKGQLITNKTLSPGNVPVIAGGKQPAYFHAFANRSGRTITISASGASAGYVALYNVPIFASDCSTVSESPDYNLDFIYYQMASKQQIIYKSQTGGAQPHVHAKDLNPIMFFFPPLAEQGAIAAVLSDMDAELSALEARRDKAIALKRGMMQELLTGRIRLV